MSTSPLPESKVAGMELVAEHLSPERTKAFRAMGLDFVQWALSASPASRWTSPTRYRAIRISSRVHRADTVLRIGPHSSDATLRPATMARRRSLRTARIVFAT